MSISELLSTATDLHHLRHPNTVRKKKEVSLCERIAGVVLFALSGLVTLGIMYAFYLVTAYKKVSKNPQNPGTKKIKKTTKSVFDQKKAKMTAPLFDAVAKGDLTTLQQLLATKPLTINFFNNDGLPLLIFAIRQQQHAIVKYIVNEPDLNVDITRFNLGMDVGYTALHEAAVLDDVQTIQLLLQKGIDPNVIDGEGRAPIHHAIHQGHVEAIKALMADQRVDIQVKDTQEGGFTPFLFAIYRQQYDIVNAMIKNRGSELRFDDGNDAGDNIFHLLFGSRFKKKFKELFNLVFSNCPASIRKKLLNEKDVNGKIPYEVAKEALKEGFEDLQVNGSLSATLQKKHDEIAELVELLNPKK